MPFLEKPFRSITSLPLESSNTKTQSRVDPSTVASIILGGGQGSRLFPLTLSRCKPAVPFGANYRLIDIPLSSSINSGFNKVFILTQFLSSSLHEYLIKNYQFDSFSSGSINLLAPEQTPQHQEWYQGTADAVRKNLKTLLKTSAEYYLILSGDHLYNIDFQKMVDFASSTQADLVVGTTPVDAESAPRMGILSVDENSSITDFTEKPQEKALLDQFKVDPDFFCRNELVTYNRNHWLASMGIYVFSRKALISLLEPKSFLDFGKDVIPYAVNSKDFKVSSYLYGGYWEDIGTLKSFFNSNLALTQTRPSFKDYDDLRPVYSQKHPLPGSKFLNSHLSNALISDGCILDNVMIERSILGPRTTIQPGTKISNTYIMGNEFYEGTKDYSPKIGHSCRINNAIIDKNVCIGNHVKLVNKDNLTEYDSPDIYIREGIIVVMKGAQIPDGFEL
jgi:glucose-1-phosphate adenylyltransferase